MVWVFSPLGKKAGSMYNTDNPPKVGDMVYVAHTLRHGDSRSAFFTRGQIGIVTRVFDDYVRLDIEEQNTSGGLWFDEISPAVEFEYEYV